MPFQQITQRMGSMILTTPTKSTQSPLSGRKLDSGKEHSSAWVREDTTNLWIEVEDGNSDTSFDNGKVYMTEGAHNTLSTSGRVMKSGVILDSKKSSEHTGIKMADPENQQYQQYLLRSPKLLNLIINFTNPGSKFGELTLMFSVYSEMLKPFRYHFSPGWSVLLAKAFALTR
jgi:hypothetical protein